MKNSILHKIIKQKRHPFNHIACFTLFLPLSLPFPFILQPTHITNHLRYTSLQNQPSHRRHQIHHDNNYDESLLHHVHIFNKLLELFLDFFSCCFASHIYLIVITQPPGKTMYSRLLRSLISQNHIVIER